jgi:type III secretory pathway component EscS
MNDMIREGCIILLIFTLVPLLVTGVVGLTLSVLQASMQLQEQSISFLVRIVTCVATLLVMRAVMIQGSANFMRRCIALSSIRG